MKKYIVKELFLKAETRGEIEKAFYQLMERRFWKFEILKINDDYLIERYSNRKRAYYVHYSRSKDLVDVSKTLVRAHYKRGVIDELGPWYIFKVCGYKR